MRGLKIPLLVVVASFAVSVGGRFASVRAAGKAPAEVQKPSLAEEGSSDKLTAGQRREVSRLMTQFRRARNDAQKRAKCVEQAAAIGRPAVGALFELIAREIQPELQRYRNQFHRQTALLSEEKIGKASMAEIVGLRASVLGLSAEPKFSKETIVARGDPAIKRLEETFLVDRSEVIERSQKLQSDREKLQALGGLWERCAVYLYEALPDDEDRPKRPPSFERYLQGEEQLATGLAVPMDPRTRAVIAGNAQVAARLDPEEARAILALNLMRNLLGLSPLAIDLKLVAAARDHSSDMQRLGFFSHDSPLPGKGSFGDRAKRLGTTASAENIYRGAHDGQTANQAWFHSPGHHKNMLGRHKRVGVGRAGSYFTQMFGG